jgi:hypothetical protein
LHIKETNGKRLTLGVADQHTLFSALQQAGSLSNKKIKPTFKT